MNIRSKNCKNTLKTLENFWHTNILVSFKFTPRIAKFDAIFENSKNIDANNHKEKEVKKIV